MKNFLSDLSEPLLSDAYYSAHCQVVSLSGDDAVEKKIQALQLLFLLIPEANYGKQGTNITHNNSYAKMI